MGMVISYAAMMWLGMATQLAKSKGLLPNSQTKLLSTNGCLFLNESLSNINVTVTEETHKSEYVVNDTFISLGMENGKNYNLCFREEVFVLLKLSYWWYTLMGISIVLTVGTLVSLLTGRQDPNKLDPKLLSPLLRKAFINKQVR